MEDVASNSRRRKRGKKPKACYVCHRDHRACDGVRPCWYCVSRKIGDSCVDFQQLKDSSAATSRTNARDQTRWEIHEPHEFQPEEDNSSHQAKRKRQKTDSNNDELLLKLSNEIESLKQTISGFARREQVLSREMEQLRAQQRLAARVIKQLKVENARLSAIVEKPTVVLSDFSSPFVPFVLDKADSAFSVLTADAEIISEFTYQTVSPHFCKIFQIDSTDIIGSPTTRHDFLAPSDYNEELKKSLAHYLFSPGEPVSPIIAISALWRGYKGAYFFTTARMQVFYNSVGCASFMVVGWDEPTYVDSGKALLDYPPTIKHPDGQTTILEQQNSNNNNNNNYNNKNNNNSMPSPSSQTPTWLASLWD